MNCNLFLLLPSSSPLLSPPILFSPLLFPPLHSFPLSSPPLLSSPFSPLFFNSITKIRKKSKTSTPHLTWLLLVVFYLARKVISYGVVRLIAAVSSSSLSVDPSTPLLSPVPCLLLSPPASPLPLPWHILLPSPQTPRPLFLLSATIWSSHMTLRCTLKVC